MGDNVFKEYLLGNGLKLELVDRSKKIASDRFYLCILMRILIPIKMKWFNQVSLNTIEFNSLTNVLGNQVIFESKREKHFIEESLRKEYTSLIVDNISILADKYFGHQKFPGRFILKCFSENKNKNKPPSNSL